MIELLTGDFGSGKTTRLADRIRADVAACRRAVLLVPEQQTVLSEQAMADVLPPAAPLYFEVTNFTRLANTVFRQVGGLSYRYADAPARALVMWRAVGELLPLLHEKQSEGNAGKIDLGYVRNMAAAMGELSAMTLTPAKLEAAAKKLEEGNRLREKLEDLSLLGAMYHGLLRETYNDVGEDLDRLADLLSGNDLFAGTAVYVDGFISFTEQEWRVLAALAQKTNLTLTLTLPDGQEEASPMLEVADTARRLSHLAEKAGVPFRRTSCGAGRRGTPLVRALAPLLFGTGQPEGGARLAAEDSLRVVACENAYASAAWIACDIARRVTEEGAHYRDFAVICRRAESYVGVLDTALEDAEIPCFMAKHTDITSYRAVKLILTAYAVCTGSYRQRDVLSYLKCGMSGVAENDADMFELYVTRWKIDGARFTDPDGWNMNPDGYTDQWTARGREMVSTVERVRQHLVAQLSPLAASCRCRPVPEHCRALYDFLLSLSVEEQLRAEAANTRAAGLRAEAEEIGRLFGVILSALDTLCDTLAGVSVDADAFVDLFRLLLSQVTLSRIPTSQDEVTVGSADLLRLGNAKHVYLLGVNDGEFPASVTEEGVFSDRDRRVLEEIGLSIRPDLLRRCAREWFCFTRAFCAAKESVTLLYATASPTGAPLEAAAPLSRILALTDTRVMEDRDAPRLSHLWRRRPAAEYLALYRGTPEGEALRRVLASDADGGRACAALATPVSDPVCRLLPDTAAMLFGKVIPLTQSRMDSYVKCPFSYFCRYQLRLDPNREIEFDYADVGNLLHTVLERFFGRLEKEGRQIRDLSREEIPPIVEEILADYIREICPTKEQRTPRLLHLLTTLRRSAALVLSELYAEFSQSDFVPRFFEMGIGEEGEDAPGTLPFVLPGGTRILLRGRIDRVDTWKNGDKTYLRVVDYKSGAKQFSLDDIERGLNTQLLVYLFSLWKSENPSFCRSLAGEGGKLLPAGVLYTGARAADVTEDRPIGREEAFDEAAKKIPRSGLLLRDETVLRAMEKTLAGRYIPVEVKKDGTFKKNSEPSLASLAEMGQLVHRLEEVICRIGGELAGGVADARPATIGKVRACETCEMQSVCRATLHP